MAIKVDTVLDAKGLACPMPIVKTKKEIKTMLSGEVLEVHATDSGSTADIKAWAESAGHEYLGTEEEAEILKHYIKKSNGDDQVVAEQPKIATASNDEVAEKLTNDTNMTLLDVREVDEFSFNHIPGAINIPLGDIENRASELDKEKDIYIICRTGNRSDMAGKVLSMLDFKKVFNVIPGMIQWTGKTEGTEE